MAYNYLVKRNGNDSFWQCKLIPNIDMNSNSYYIRLSAVIERTSLSRSTIYRLIAEGSFPSQVPIGARSVAWVNHEIEDWCIDKLSNR